MSEKLFNTEEAADFLRVSQASIRRWSDAGLLPVRRLGRRRERRFMESDLRHFLGAAGRSSGPVGVPHAVSIGGTSIPVHSHLATFYNSDAGRLRLTIPFFVDGLRAGQPCFLAADGAILDAYDRALRSHAVDVDAAIRSGLFVTTPGPGDSAPAALAYWEHVFWTRLERGPTLLRLVGEMVSVRRLLSSDEEMIRFEVAFNDIAKRLPTVSVCQYDVREFDGEAIYGAIRAHPDLYDHFVGSFLN